MVLQHFSKLLTTIGLLIGSLLLINLAIDNPYSHRFVATMLNEKVATQTSLKLTFEGLEISVFPPAITLYGLSVRPRQYPNIRLLEASRLRLRVALRSIFTGVLRLSRVEANELRLSLPFPAGLAPFITAKSDDADTSDAIFWPPEGAPMIDQLALINTNIRIHSPIEVPRLAPEFDLRLKGLDTELDLNSWDDLSLAFKSSAAEVLYRGKPMLADSALSFAASLVGTQLQLKDLKIAGPTLKLHGNAKADLSIRTPEVPLLILQKPPRPRLLGINAAAQLEAEAGFEILGGFLEIPNTDGTVSGPLSLSIGVGFAPDFKAKPFLLEGPVKAKAGRIAGFKIYDTEANLQITQSGLNLSPFVLVHQGRNLATGRGRIGFDKAVSLDFRARPLNLPLTRVLEAVQVPDFDVVDALISADNLVVRGTSVPFNLAITADATFAHLISPFLGPLSASYSKPPACRLAVQLDVTTTRLSLDGSRGHCAKSTADLSTNTQSKIALAGKIGFDERTGMDLKIDLPKLDLSLAESFARVSLAGDASVAVGIAGPYQSIETKGQFRSHQVAVQGLPWGLVQAQFAINTKTAAALFTDVKSSHENGMQWDIPRLSLTLHEPWAFQAKVNGSHIPAGFVGAALNLADPDLPLSFNVPNISGTLSGDLLKPLAWQGSLGVELSQGYYLDELWFSKVSGRLNANTQESELSDLQLVHGDFKATGNIKRQHRQRAPGSTQPHSLIEELGASLQDHIQIKIRSDNTVPAPGTLPDATDHLSELPVLGAILQAQDIKGRLSLNADLAGTLGRLDGQFSGNVSALRVQKNAIAPVFFQGIVEGGHIEIPVINHSGRALMGRFAMDILDPNLAYSWYFNFNNLDLRSFLGGGFDRDPRNFAYLRGDWTMQGQLSNWWASKGTLSLQELRTSFTRDVNGRAEKVLMVQMQPVDIDISPAGWTIRNGETLRLAGPDLELNLSTLDNRPPTALGLNFTGTFSLSILRNLIGPLETARGKLQLQGQLSGEVSDPNLSFTVRDQRVDPTNIEGWEPVSFGIVDLPPAFTNIRAEISFLNGRFAVQSFSGNKGKEGRFNINGNYNFSATDENENRLAATFEKLEFFRLPIPVFDTIDATASGNLLLQGTSLPLRLSGNVNIDSARSITNFDIRNRILDAISVRRIAQSAAPAAALLELDLKIVADESIYLKNRNMAVTLGADLTLKGPETSPIALGNITIPRGRFSYKRDFDIKRGLLLFDEGISPPDPKMDIIGEALVNGYRVNVLVNGRASDPKISLMADPAIRADGTPISKMDIIVLLSSGSLPTGDRNNASGAAAQSEALSLVAGRFEEPLEKLFELSGQDYISEVYLDTYTPANNSSKGTRDTRPVGRVNLPIKIVDDLAMTLQLDDDRNLKLSTDYTIHENITASVILDRKSESEAAKDKADLPDTGLDLRFRFAFP